MFDLSPKTITIITAVTSILGIATTAIGLEAYNKDENLKKEKASNYGFLVFVMVVLVIALLVSLVAAYGLFVPNKYVPSGVSTFVSKIPTFSPPRPTKA